MSPTVRRASLDDLDALAPLFDRYRHFYTQRYDEAASRAFIAQRLQRDESAVFLAELDAAPVGFTQLYPTFSSVRAARVWVLNDLYVDPSARRHGVARALTEGAIEHARADGAIRVELETMPENRSARALYEASGWSRYDETLRYHFTL